MRQIILPDPVTLFWHGPLFRGAVKISYFCITVVPYVNLITASSFDLGLLLSYFFSEQYQRLSWEALKKSINGLINKVNVSNIKDICKELFCENLVCGR